MIVQKALLSKLSREAHPNRAAERQQTVATGVSPWAAAFRTSSAGGAADFCGSFSPPGWNQNDTLSRAHARGYSLPPLMRLNNIPARTFMNNPG